jgi:hypothetical protein
MRAFKNLGLILLWCCGPAWALSIDGEAQLHAAFGQPLSVAVPVSLAGDEVSRLYYRLTPAAGLAEAEEHAAASVHAGYDPATSAITLSTSSRVTVPAIRLHLELGAGDVVVGRDITVLFDLPDLNASAPLVQAAAQPMPKPTAGEARAELAAMAVPDGARGIAIQKQEPQGAGALAFGDSAARTAAPAAPAQPQMVLAPPPHYFNRYQVRRGDTLATIGEHFARAGAGSAEAVMLAVYEANVEDFPTGDPQHPIVGRQLDVPDAASIGTEPRYRISEFREYLRKPVGEWQVPVNLQRRKATAAPAEEPVVQLPWWRRNLHLLIGLAAVALLVMGLRKLFSRSHYARAVAEARRAANPGAAPAQPGMFINAFEPPREPASASLLTPEPETEHAEVTRLRELLEQQPTRADLRLRLVQRLYEARRASGFAEVALPLRHVLQAEPWEKVRQMGHELLPYDYRFQPQQALTALSPAMRALMEPVRPPEPAPPAPAPAPGAATIDFDFHGEMSRVDKARRDVFGDRGGGQQQPA